MMDLNSTNFTEEELYKLNIHELRDIARQIGVSSPTTRKKEELVHMTLQIVYGEAPAHVQKSGAGRPVRVKTKPSRILYDLQNQNTISLAHPDNLFSSRYKVNPEDIFVGANAVKVAQEKTQYDVSSGASDEFVSLSDESSNIFVSGVVVSSENGLVLEAEMNDGVHAFAIDDAISSSFDLEPGDVIECNANTVACVVTSLISKNGEFIL